MKQHKSQILTTCIVLHCNGWPWQKRAQSINNYTIRSLLLFSTVLISFSPMQPTRQRNRCPEVLWLQKTSSYIPLKNIMIIIESKRDLTSTQT